MDAASKSSGSLECAICLQTCIYPVELPCGHIFCYLCVKGIANQSKKCAMCRQEIPRDYLENPKLVSSTADGEVASEEEVVANDEYQWFYEGRNGWWKYDARTNKELDMSFQRGVRCCELLIAGFLYIVDFDSMLQFRRNDPSRRRRIKRDVISIPVKGIAGIKFRGERRDARVKTPEVEGVEEVTLVPPSNTPASVEDSGATTPDTVDTPDRYADRMRTLSLDAVMGLIAEGIGANDSNDSDENMNDIVLEQNKNY